MDNISKARKGNKKAIKQVIKDNIEQMYKLVFLHTKYEDDAKRILTDTMYFIEGNMSKLDENQNIILWLYKITIINTNNFLKYVATDYNNNKHFLEILCQIIRFHNKLNFRVINCCICFVSVLYYRRIII